MGEAERTLTGGSQNAVTAAGGVVYRSGGPQSSVVLDLLRHLERVGFPASPRVVEPGFDSRHREMLGFIEGEQQSRPWDDDALVAIGTLLRSLHHATESFDPPPDASWRSWFGRNLPGSRPVIGHGDLGPWNILARKGTPIAFIDWDYAGPVDAVWELAQTAWLNVQLHDDDLADELGLPDPPTRARQLRLFLDAYGLPQRDRDGFVDKLIEFAVHDAREESLLGKVDRNTTSGLDDNGFPTLWAITWRTRSASWMLRHRSELERAIESRTGAT